MEILGLQEKLAALQQELAAVQEEARQNQPRITLKMRIVDPGGKSSKRAADAAQVCGPACPAASLLCRCQIVQQQQQQQQHAACRLLVASRM